MIVNCLWHRVGKARLLVNTTRFLPNSVLNVKPLNNRNYSEVKILNVPEKLLRKSVGVVAKIFHNKNMAESKQNLRSDAIVWIDCEMTGLDISTDLLMEIAVIITDGNLDTISELNPVIIHTPELVLQRMNPWCIQHHEESGLTEACRKSTTSLADAENIVADFLTKYVQKGSCPLGGNSVHMDRMFLAKYMPKVTNHLHYRNIDVSTIKELSRRWYPEQHSQAPRKQFTHRGLSDIKESIEELRYYRHSVFK